MNCKICKHGFCWVCLGAWADHGQSTGGFYKCNKFVGTGAGDKDQSSVARAKAELERYLHYYQRYHNHDESAKFARKHREQAERRMGELPAAEVGGWVDVQFLQQAVEQIIDCRRVLKYTYVLGYFLSDESPQRGLFEYHQEMLEKSTEKLSELTESASGAAENRTNIVNLTRIADKFLASLLASLVDGNIIETGDTL